MANTRPGSTRRLRTSKRLLVSTTGRPRTRLTMPTRRLPTTIVAALVASGTISTAGSRLHACQAEPSLAGAAPGTAGLRGRSAALVAEALLEGRSSARPEWRVTSRGGWLCFKAGCRVKTIPLVLPAAAGRRGSGMRPFSTFWNDCSITVAAQP
jgi:hypothetical protein